MNGRVQTGLALALAAVTTVAATATLSAVSAPRQARQDSQTQPPIISTAELKKALGSPTTVVATVAAVDYDDRVVVLRDEKGMDHALFVGEEVKRFKDLKVGDKLKVTYYMSLATRLLQPGEAGRPGTTEGVVGTAGSPRPAGTVSLQERRVVTVNSVDPAQQTITVTGDKGRVFTFKVDDKAKLANVKQGDRIEVVFTAAALLNVEPAN